VNDSAARSASEAFAIGDAWDASDARAAAIRARAVHAMISGPGRIVERDEGLPKGFPQPQLLEDLVATTRHDHEDGSYAMVTLLPTLTPEQGRLHVRIVDHPFVKDMSLSIRMRILRETDVDAASCVDDAASMLERYADALGTRGRGCHASIRSEAYDTMSALILQCNAAWRSDKGFDMKILNVSCPTPWSRAEAWITSAKGGRTDTFLTGGSRRILEDALPTAMAVVWTDEVEKGTGTRSTVLSITPLNLHGLAMPKGEGDPMEELRAHERLRLPENGILRLS
jgi:hypothetical protein